MYSVFSQFQLDYYNESTSYALTIRLHRKMRMRQNQLDSDPLGGSLQQGIINIQTLYIQYVQFKHFSMKEDKKNNHFISYYYLIYSKYTEIKTVIVKILYIYNRRGFHS